MVDEQEAKKAQQQFKLLDKNGDGYVPLDTLMDFSREQDAVNLPEATTTEDILNLIPGGSVKEVGGTSMIGYTEFLSLFLKRVQYFQEERLKASFQFFDRDKDGFITADEIKMVMGERINVDELTNGKGLLDYDDYVKLMSDEDWWSVAINESKKM